MQSHRGLFKSSAEYQGDHVWRFKATRIESRRVPPEYPESDDSASYAEELLEYWRENRPIPEYEYETVYIEIEVEALFYERTGVVVWVKWY